MTKYYVNKNAQNNGDHEVHKQGCFWLPKPENRKYLGEFYSCFSAILEAEKYYEKVDGCRTCATTCHKS